jgi:hypothetical protein
MLSHEVTHVICLNQSVTLLLGSIKNSKLQEGQELGIEETGKSKNYRPDFPGSYRQTIRRCAFHWSILGE